MTRYAMAIDLERCLGCEACLVACKAENEVPLGYYRIRMRESVTGTFPNLQAELRPKQCFHCDNPPCVASARREPHTKRRRASRWSTRPNAPAAKRASRRVPTACATSIPTDTSTSALSAPTAWPPACPGLR